MYAQYRSILLEKTILPILLKIKFKKGINFFYTKIHYIRLQLQYYGYQVRTE